MRWTRRVRDARAKVGFTKRKKRKKSFPGKEETAREGDEASSVSRSGRIFRARDELAGRAVSEGRTKRAEAETAAIMVVVHSSSNRYGSLASCAFSLAAMIPPVSYTHLTLPTIYSV